MLRKLVLFPLPLIQRDGYFNKLHYLAEPERQTENIYLKWKIKFSIYDKWFALHLIHILWLEKSKSHLDIPANAKAH